MRIDILTENIAVNYLAQVFQHRQISSSVMPNLPSGQLGSASIVLLTITTEEFDIVKNEFGLLQNISGSGYYISSPAKAIHYDIVLRRASSQTNMGI